MATKSAQSPHAAERVDQLLSEIVARHPEESAVVEELRSLVSGVETEAARSKPTSQRRSGEGVQYHVKRSARSSALYEHRPGGAPLRVGEEIFTGVVRVLAGANRPLAHDEIAEGLAKQLNVSEWQIRVVLRFLQQTKPPALRRSRSRYSPAEDSKRFVANADKHWRAAAQA